MPVEETSSVIGPELVEDVEGANVEAGAGACKPVGVGSANDPKPSAWRR